MTVGIGVAYVAPAVASDAPDVRPYETRGVEVSLPDKGIPPEVRAAIQHTVETPAGEKINDLMWNAETATLDVHVINDDEALDSVLRDALGNGYRIVQDQYSSKELGALAYELATEGVASGIPIATITTAENNSGLIVTLIETRHHSETLKSTKKRSGRRHPFRSNSQQHTPPRNMPAGGGGATPPRSGVDHGSMVRTGTHAPLHFR